MNDEPSGESTPPDDAPAEPDEVTGANATDRTAPETDTYTTDVRRLDSRVRWLWVGRAILLGLVAGGTTLAITYSAAPEWEWVSVVVFGLVAGLGTTHGLLLYRSWRYEVRDDSLLLERGVLTHVKTVVPYVRVQHVDNSHGPIERVVGLASLVVYTAGTRGADVTVPGLTPAEAEDLQTRLKVLAIESEGEDAV